MCILFTVLIFNVNANFSVGDKINILKIIKTRCKIFSFENIHIEYSKIVIVMYAKFSKIQPLN